MLLWHPPPAAAGAAIEQLGYSRHKRQRITHIFVCPRLMTHLLRKRLFKISDFLFHLPAGHRDTVWPAHMFEPLTFGILLPFTSSSPWVHRRSPSVLALEIEMRTVWQNPQGDERVVLWKLWD